MKVMFDTSALITLSDVSRPNHAEAQRCYDALVGENALMITSAIAVSEYGVKGNVQDILGLQSIVVQDFNVLHAEIAASFKRYTMTVASGTIRTECNTRAIVTNDTQILAQAHVEDVDYILTEDERTFARTANALKDANLMSAEVILLRDNPVHAMGLMKQSTLDL